MLIFVGEEKTKFSSCTYIIAYIQDKVISLYKIFNNNFRSRILFKFPCN